MAKGSEMTEMTGIEIQVDGHKYKATRLCSYSKEEFGVYVDFQGDYPVGGTMAMWVIIPAGYYGKKEFVRLVTKATREEIEKLRKQEKERERKKHQKDKSEDFAKLMAERLGIRAG